MDKGVKFTIEFESNGSKVIKDISVSSDSLRNAVKEVTSEVKSMSKEFDEMGKSVVVMNSALGIINSMKGIVDGLANDWNSFDKAMRAANTMAGKNTDELGILKKQVAALGNEIPKTKDELASGLYQVISNGVPENNWISFLEQSAKASVGGVADLGQTVTVTSTIIKNYGLDWDKVGEIQDKIQMTAKNGVTSFEQLAAALPRVSGNAATLGVSIDELMASFATLTGVSGNTAEVSTQLAAIFTALVKPSSEATKMAQEMGIQFDAAAIKAAGGMQNFLTQLSADISSYASSHNMLEQEIYGKLFGSAESLRALTPLTGELASKFGENVEAMAGSAGSIDQAFANMAGSGESVTQMLKNQLSTMADWIGGVASAIQPYLSFVAVLGQSLIGLSTARKGFILLVDVLKKYATAQRTGAAATALATLHERIQMTARNMLTAVTGGTTVATWALTAATIALYAALTMGISAVITGLVTLFSNMSDETEELDEKSRKLIDTQERAKRESEAAEQMREQERTSLENVRAELELNIAKTKNFHGSKKDEISIVNSLNNKYGETMGYFSSVVDWYNALVTNSDAYCKQMIIEARTRSLANQIARREEENREIEENFKNRKYSHEKKTLNVEWTYDWKNGVGIKETKGLSDAEKAALTWSRNKKANNNDEKTMNDLAKTVITMPVRGSGTKPDLGGGGGGSDKDKDKNKNSDKENTRLEQLNALIAKNKEAYVNADEAARTEIVKNIQEYKKEKDQIEQLHREAMRPIELNSLQDIDDEISYQQSLRKHASKDQIAGIDAVISKLEQQKAEMSRPTELNSLKAIDDEISYQQKLRNKANKEKIADIDSEIERLGRLRKELERAGHKELATDQITTYEQLDKEVAYYTDLLKTSGEKERADIQKRINKLNELREKWDEVLGDLEKPGDIGILDTTDKLDKAIAYYQGKQKKATGDEIDNIGKTVAALERKRTALMRGADIQEQIREAGEINSLNGGEFRVKVQAMGFDELTDKIRSLKKMLNDTENPLTEAQKKSVESLISTYDKWREVSVKSMSTVKKGWDGLKGIGSGVESITDALKENGNAWKKVTSIIDGMLQIYDSFSGIISIIKMITEATKENTVAKSTEAGVVAAGAAVEVGATEAVSEANKKEMTTSVGAAAGETMKAHAGIPFAGIAIGAGLVASLLALMFALPKFANGGVIYGPTLGLMGEYGGASNNPEVVAPLSKLKGLLADEIMAGNGVGHVKFRIDGRDLVGVLEKENNWKLRVK